MTASLGEGACLLKGMTTYHISRVNENGSEGTIMTATQKHTLRRLSMRIGLVAIPAVSAGMSSARRETPRSRVIDPAARGHRTAGRHAAHPALRHQMIPSIALSSIPSTASSQRLHEPTPAQVCSKEAVRRRNNRKAAPRSCSGPLVTQTRSTQERQTGDHGTYAQARTERDYDP